MTKIKLGLTVAALALAACGGNNDTSNNVNGLTNNTSPNNTGTNNNVATNNTTPNNITPNNITPNNITPNNVNNNTVVPIDAPPTCSDTPRPAACDEDPATKTFSPTSVVTEFIVEGTEDEAICCYDYGGLNGDEIDNSLGQNLAGFGFLGDINSSVTTSIAEGSLVLLLEHSGLTDLANEADYVVNFYIGAHADEAAFLANGFLPAGGNEVLINPASFDEGAHPQAYMPDASNTAGAVTAGPGAVKIEIVLFDSPLQLTISVARTDATIDAAASALDGAGIALTGGQLGGVVRVRDIFVAVNEFAAASCECLGLGAEDLVNPDNGMCSANADADACTAAAMDTCAEVAGACNLFGAVGLFADIDLDGDGLTESVSIGSTYSAVGATITGIAP